MQEGAINPKKRIKKRTHMQGVLIVNVLSVLPIFVATKWL